MGYVGKMMIKEILHCCEDFRITFEDYKHITLKSDLYRFQGHVINRCPYCGVNLNADRKM